MKKSLVLSALMFVFSISMLAGSTYAWWSEDIVVDENIIQMGDLDMKFELNDPQEDAGDTWYDLEDYQTTGIFETTNTIEPGQTDTRRVRVTNEGSITMAYRLQNNVLPSEGLNSHITFNIEAYNGFTIYNSPLQDMTTDFIILAPGQSHVYDVTYTVSTDLGNGGENLDLEWDFTIQAKQVAKAKTLGNVYRLKPAGGVEVVQ